MHHLLGSKQEAPAALEAELCLISMPSGQKPSGRGHSRPGQQDRHSRAPACPVLPWLRGKERARRRIWHLALSTRRPGHKKWSFSRKLGETLLTVLQTDGLGRATPGKEVTPQYVQGDLPAAQQPQWGYYQSGL